MTPKHKDHPDAANRKDQVLDAAAALFANNGFYKTTTAMVAAEVGVTQPYVFHFFKTKEELYLAVLDRALQRLIAAFVSVEAPPEQLAGRMGHAFTELMATHRDEILLCMQSFTTPESNIREYVRGQFVRVFEVVTERFLHAGTANAKQEASIFISCGLLITLSEVLGIPELVGWLEPPCE